ncbi:MAG: DUF3303 domain-containing protein [Cytophagales bacterium]|nr:DUF3303 domain-containing protein [Cytophagales bacterium]
MKVEGAWLGAQTGIAYVVVEADKDVDLYHACSRWTEYGTLKMIPVVSLSEI